MHSREGMRDGHAQRVQRMTRKAGERPAINGVPADRRTARREMHADLMPASGQRPATEDRPALIAHNALITSGTRCAVISDDAPPAVRRIRSEWKIDLTAFRFDVPLDDSEILLLGLGPGSLQRRMRRRTFRKHDDAGRQLVETADNGEGRAG